MIGIAVLAIAAVVITGGLLAPLVAAGTMSAMTAGALAAGAGAIISIGGNLLLNTFLPPPTPEVAKNQGNDAPSYAITGQRNTAQNWAKVPFLLGRFKLTPPHAALPYREVVGNDIYWRALFAFSHGPIHIESMWIGDTPLGNFQDVEWQHRRGYWSMPDKGGWSAATGQFPASPAFGDTWTCTVAGGVGGQSYSIGETITFNDLAPPSDPWAWDRDQGKSFSLFPHDVYEDPLNVAVKYGTPQVRTSQLNGDELSVELVFERGVVHLENCPAGKTKDSEVRLRVE